MLFLLPVKILLSVKLSFVPFACNKTMTRMFVGGRRFFQAVSGVCWVFLDHSLSVVSVDVRTGVRGGFWV